MAGLKTEGSRRNHSFWRKISKKALKAGSLGEWTPAQARQFQTLTHPEHLGRAFRVLTQSR